MIKIKLEWYEVEMGALAAVQRQCENMRLGRKPFHGVGHASDWQVGIEGALGEMALAKYLNLYWSGKGEFRGADVGNYEVRTAGFENGNLILHERDDDNKIFWLLCGLNGEYTVKGWIYAGEGKKQEYWETEKLRSPAYLVPQSKLNKPEELL